MKKEGCGTCLFGDICNEGAPCYHHSSTTEAVEDLEVRAFIERRREENLREWVKYLEYCNDDPEAFLSKEMINEIKGR